VLLDHQDRHAEAEEVYVELLEITRTELGDEHRETLLAMFNLGLQYGGQERHADAAVLYLEWARVMLSSTRPVADPDSPWGGYEPTTALEAVRALNSAAVGLGWSDDLVVAQQLLEKALAVQEAEGDAAADATLGGMIRANLAGVLVRLGEADEAEGIAREALATFQDEYGDGHPYSATTERVVGSALVAQGRATEAEPLLRHCVATLRSADGWAPWRVANAESALGECLVALGAFAEAEPLLLESYETIREAKGDAFHATRTARRRIDALYEVWGPSR
jgi:tetratricopeptide (TPR) repeat protein